MTDRPILFSGPMVRAILEGSKTQTRRVLHKQPPEWASLCQQPTMLNALHQWVPSGLWTWCEPEHNPPRPLQRWPVDADGEHYWLDPRYHVGDRLWVREAHYLTDTGDLEEAVCIADDAAVKEHLARIARIERAHPTLDWSRHKRRRPGIHMPRWASRLTLTVTDVRVERLQDISAEDAKAEGADALANNPFGSERDALPSYRWGFSALWASINGASLWNANPWVVALTFAVTTANIDTLPNSEAAR